MLTKCIYNISKLSIMLLIKTNSLKTHVLVIKIFRYGYFEVLTTNIDHQ